MGDTLITERRSRLSHLMLTFIKIFTGILAAMLVFTILGLCYVTVEKAHAEGNFLILPLLGTFVCIIIGFILYMRTIL